MKQAIHIFRKDLRRLWVETALSVAALGVLTWSEWRLWTPGFDSRFRDQILPLLVFAFSSWFLVMRLIHGEALAGEQRFWMTRPYGWRPLLGAKGIFGAVCIAVPFLLSQVALLLLNHSPVLSNLSNVAGRTATVILIGVLPFAAVAALTRSASQWVSGVMLMILLLVGMAALESQIPDRAAAIGAHVAWPLEGVAFGLLASCGLVSQYMQRRWRWGVTWMIAAVIAVPVVMFATPYRMLMATAFPVVSRNRAGFQGAFVPNERQRQVTPDWEHERQIALGFSFVITNVRLDELLQVNAAMLSLDPADGAHWDSEWQQGEEGHLLTNVTEREFTVEMERGVYERFTAAAVPARLTLAVSELRANGGQDVQIRKRFELPGVGACWLENNSWGFDCRSIDGEPELLVESTLDENFCHVAPRTPNGRIRRQLSFGRTEGPLNPLRLHYVSSSPQGERGAPCALESVRLSWVQVVRRFRVEVALGAVRLEDY